MRRRRREGFTILEAAIGGAVLLLGTVSVLQLTRIALKMTDGADPRESQDSRVIEQFMRTSINLVKANRDSALFNAFPTLHLPGGDVTVAQSNSGGVTGLSTLRTYTLTFTQNTYLVGKIQFLKVDTNDANRRAGI